MEEQYLVGIGALNCSSFWLPEKSEKLKQK